MIIKSLSRKSGGIGQLFRYLFREEKVTRKTYTQLVTMLDSREVAGKPVYVAGIKLSSNDVKYLRSEIQDAKLLADLKVFKGTLKEFIQQQLITHRPEIVKESKALVITHNMRSRSVNEYIKEFEKNEANRIYQRSNQTAVYHTILSWSNKDTVKITDAMLREMSKEYVRLRGENNLYCFTKHEDKDHTHLHCTVSGTQLNGLSSRISKQDFARIKIEMDFFQRTHFPDLVHSFPNHGRVDKDKTHTAESKNIKSERSSEKESLLGLLETTFEKATSVEHFLAEIKANGHEPYFRNGRLQGIKYEGERKFRLKPLGYDEEKLKALDAEKIKAETALKELSSIRNRSKEVQKNKEIETTTKENTAPLIEAQQKALQKITEIRDGKNSRDSERVEDSDKDRDISDDKDDIDIEDADVWVEDNNDDTDSDGDNTVEDDVQDSDDEI